MADDTDINASITKLVTDVVTALVDAPDEVVVQAREEGSALIVEVKVAPDDTGKVIGRQGRIVKSLRTLARAASSFAGGRHVEVEILD
jgi:predicted RNA-binding protein YlqC (UPF0109 family)